MVSSADWMHLVSTEYALIMSDSPTMKMVSVWQLSGYMILIYVAGFMGLNQDVMEAASIDGANAWQTFRYITLPLLKPTMLFVVVTSIISYLQAYVPVLVMTKGGPGTSTYLSSYLVYDQAFKQYNFGYASAISLFILVLTAIFTVISFKVTGEKN